MRVYDGWLIVMEKFGGIIPKMSDKGKFIRKYLKFQRMTMNKNCEMMFMNMFMNKFEKKFMNMFMKQNTQGYEHLEKKVHEHVHEQSKKSIN